MTINRKPQDTSVSSLPSKIISSQAVHSYSPVTASPVCQSSSPIRAGRETVLPGYDGRMTTSPRTTAPAPAAAPVDAHDAAARAAWLAARAAAPSHDARHAVDMEYVRAARVRAVFAGVDTVDAL